MVDINWLLGIGILLGLTFLFTFLTSMDFITFLIWLNIFGGFVVWSGLLPLWIVVLNLIILTIILATSFTSNKNR